MTWKKKLRRGIKYPLLILLIRILLFVIKILPKKTTFRSFAFLGLVTYKLMKKERNKTISNLKIAYGDSKTDEEIEQMAKEVWINLGKSAAEFARKFHAKNKEEFFRDVEIIGEENFRNAYKKGTGVVCIVVHMGSWECIPWAVTYLGFKTGTIGKPLGDKRLNRLLVNSRERKGFKVLPRGTSYKAMLNFLKSNHALGVLIDQDTNVKGTFVDFYGKKAFTPVGAAMLALDADAEVIPVVYKKKENEDSYQFISGKAFELYRSGDRETDLQINTQNFHKWIEDMIKKDPTQWVWMHERWKTTPELLKKKEEERMEQRRKRREASKAAKDQ